jgi:uncharacterized protein (TIGR02452 family)
MYCSSSGTFMGSFCSLLFQGTSMPAVAPLSGVYYLASMSIELAQHTLQILDKGQYIGPDGAVVTLRDQIRAARENTILYRPANLKTMNQEQLQAVLDQDVRPIPPPSIEVTTETTVQAARRLVQQENRPQVLALNFASGKHPGGGFLQGKTTQEESLAYSSALYPCLLQQAEYYDANKTCGTPFYTHHMIYSPDVPFFRDERFRLLPAPFSLSVLTAPAPNLRDALETRHRSEGSLLGEDTRIRLKAQEILISRVYKLLGVAVQHGHRNLVLGAWGCGVFDNDPKVVADAFFQGLDSFVFSGCFDQVTFAVAGPSENLNAFRTRFG